MTVAIGYALGAMVLYGLGDFVFKQAAIAAMRGEFKTHHFVMMQSGLFFCCTLAFVFASGDAGLGWPVLWGTAAGVFMFIGFNNFAWSLREGNVSLNAPIFRLNFIVTSALAILLLAEPLTGLKLAGLALALAAIWLLMGAGAGNAASMTPAAKRSLLLAVSATLALGAGNFLHKIGLSQGAKPATLLSAHSLVFLVLSTLAAVRADAGLSIPRSVWKYSAAGAAMTSGGFLLLLRALSEADASVVVPIAQMGLLVTAALGVIVLREAITARKLAGLSAAVAALGALAAS